MIPYVRQLLSTFAYIRQHYGVAAAIAALVGEGGTLLLGALGWWSTQVGRAAALPAKARAWIVDATLRVKFWLLLAEMKGYRAWLRAVAAARDVVARWAAWRDDHPAVDFALWMALSLAVTALAFWIGVNLVALR